MNKSNLIPVLKSFSKDETKEFEKFLDSPFFGCGKFVLNFYKVLIKYYPVFNEEDIKKEKIFGILYLDKKYNDALTRRIISDLLRFSEEYMTYENFRSNSAFRSSCTLNELRNRKLDNLFRLRSESLLNKINSSEVVDPLLILESYFISLEISEYRSFIRDEKMHETLGQTVEVLIVFFLRVIIHYSNHTVTFSNEIKTKNEIYSAFMNNFNYDSFVEIIGNNKNRYSVYLKMLSYCHNIIADFEDIRSCNELIKLINNNPGYFTKNELNNIYVIAIKFYTIQNEKYDYIYVDEIFSIYNIILKEKLYLDSGKIFQLSFCRSFIRLCLFKQDTKRIKLFSEDHHSNLPEIYRQDLTEYCNSIYFFGEKLFERSLFSAGKVNIDRELFKMDVKIFKIKNYYELEYYDSIYSEIDNLKHFLTESDTITPHNMIKTRNFIKYISSVMRGKENKSGVDLFVLKKELEKEKLITEKKWLIEKIDELNKK